MKKEKLDPRIAIVYFICGVGLYFLYSVLLQYAFHINPNTAPISYLSTYFVICTLMFPYSGSYMQKKTPKDKITIGTYVYTYIAGPILLLTKKKKK